MIKTLGIEAEFETCSYSEIIGYFNEREALQYDSETSSLSAQSGHILCFQLGDFHNQFVIAGDRIKDFKEFLESKTLICQNGKFDLCFLYAQNIYPTKIYDTFLAESVISCGIKSIRRNLAAIAKRRLNVDLDKTVRDEIWKEGLTTRVIEYAAGDVKYLEQIKESQLKDIKYHDLVHALEVENQYVLALAYVEFCGFKLDAGKWRAKMESDYIDFAVAEEKLNTYLSENHPEYSANQLDLFTEQVATGINWSSSKQVVALFKKLKIPVSFVIRGETKESVEAKNIEKYSKEFKIVELYLKYKECEKEVTTYGQNFLDQINPTTGRLHTNFKQIMDTGRISSGGKDKKNKTSFINFQNIPANAETRNCFVAEPGNVIIEADFVGQEAVVLANQSLDPSLLEFYDTGMSDMHSFVASKMWPELSGLTVAEIKEKHKDKRQAAKTAGFALSYGGSGQTVARNNNMTLEEGEAVYEAYFGAFPGLQEYFESQKKKVLNAGYVQFNDIIKTKSFIEGYDDYLILGQQLNRAFWDRWKEVKFQYFEKGNFELEYKDMKSKISHYFKLRGAIERKAINFPVQGSSATITKIASIYFFKWLRENDLFGKVLIVNEVHDSIVCECPDYLRTATIKALRETMVKAGAIFCKRVPLKVEVTSGEFWKK